MTEKYYGNYLGIVVQNNDPEKRGRVKIWIPHISSTVYEKLNKKTEDIEFIFPADNTGDGNQRFNEEIVPVLKEILPWAECATPLFGGDGPGKRRQASSGDARPLAAKGEEGHGSGNEAVSRNARRWRFWERAPSADSDSNSEVSRYVDAPCGLFTIPTVGAHLWVFFKDGDPNSPVYFAGSHGITDWQHTYTSSPAIDYPGAFENDEEGDTPDNKIFRAKTVFNSNKHTLEFIDTDCHEILKMTHFTGSFDEFNNFAHINFCTNDDVKTVLGDQYIEIKKDKNMYVEGDYELITKGAHINQIGIAEPEKVKQVLEKLKDLHAYKRLFDIKRADFNDYGPKQLSDKQQRSGDFGPCPVCEYKPYAPNDKWFADCLARSIPFYVPFATNRGIPGSSFQTIFFPDPMDPSQAQGIGQRGYYAGSECDVCNSRNEIHLPEGHELGKSPSTEGGDWEHDTEKQEKIKEWIENNVVDIANLERDLGDSDQIINITKNKIETIGLVMNDIPSIRTDPFGKARIDGVHIAPEQTYSTYKPCPLVEHVDVDDIPGGDYNLTVANKYKLLVGARGINIKTFGPIDMYGTIVNLVGEQMNLVSQNEINIDGGQRLNLRGNIVSISPHEHNPLVVDGQLHVTRNAIIQGATMVEGELGVTHITAPSEYYETLQNTSMMTEVNEGHSHGIPPHTHYFVNIPMNLLKSPVEVRSKMCTAGINSVDTAQPGGAVGGAGGNTKLLGESVADIPGIGRFGKGNRRDEHLIRPNHPGEWAGGPIQECIDISNANPEIRHGLEDYNAEQISDDEIQYSCFFNVDGRRAIVYKAVRIDTIWKIAQTNVGGQTLLAIDNEKWRYFNEFERTNDKIAAKKAEANATNKILHIEKTGQTQTHFMKVKGSPREEV